MRDQGFEHESVSRVTHNKSVQATATAPGSSIASEVTPLWLQSQDGCQWLSPDLGR